MIKILIADDHPIVRMGLKQVVADTANVRVVDEAETGEEILAKVSKNDYDVVLLDIALTDMSGLDVLKRIKQIKPNIPVLMLSIHPEKYYAVQALRAGASGYVTKNRAAKELIEAINKVATGGKYISASLAEILASNLNVGLEVPSHQKLTKREYEIMLLIASGVTLKEIAHKFSISTKTVSTHRFRFLKKMGIKNNADLIHYAIENQLLE
jgi:two-component system, NarL family, invasion response regulator UvrY